MGGKESSLMAPPILSQDDETNEDSIIKNVWFDNFEDELPIISELLEKYPYIAMVSISHQISFKEIAKHMINEIITKFRIQNSLV